MPLSPSEVMELLAILTDQDGINVTVKNSVTGGIITGICATLCGIFLGPVGLAIGGAAGGGASYAMTAGRFRRLSSVIRHDMSEEQQIQLFTRVQLILSSVDAVDVVRTLALIANGSIRTLLIEETVKFVTSQMHMQVTD